MKTHPDEGMTRCRFEKKNLALEVNSQNQKLAVRSSPGTNYFLFCYLMLLSFFSVRLLSCEWTAIETSITSPGSNAESTNYTQDRIKTYHKSETVRRPCVATEHTAQLASRQPPKARQSHNTAFAAWLAGSA